MRRASLLRWALPWRPGSGWSEIRSQAGPASRTLITRVNARTAVLALIMLVLGALLTAQWQAKPKASLITPESRREAAYTTIANLEAEQSELKSTIGQLRAQIAAEQQSIANGSTLEEINQELEQQKILAGMVPLKGRGVRLTLDDSAAKTIPADEDPSLYIVHEYQIRDVINLLWLAGAEAISLNGERIVGSTSVYCVGSTILVNDTRLSPPYEVLAIGDPAALEGAVNDQANLRSMKARVKAYGLQFAVASAKEVQIPAFEGSLAIKYATLGAQATGEGDQPQQGSKVGAK